MLLLRIIRKLVKIQFLMVLIKQMKKEVIN